MNILDILLGPYGVHASTLAHTSFRRIYLPEGSYPCTVYVQADTYRRPRAFWSRGERRWRAEVVMDTPIPLAAWTGRKIHHGTPDVSGAETAKQAADWAIHRIVDDVIFQRRGARATVVA
jgi:hypothetical protein